MVQGDLVNNGTHREEGERKLSNTRRRRMGKGERGCARPLLSQMSKLELCLPENFEGAGHKT